MASVKISDLISKYLDSTHSGDIAKWLERVEMVARLQDVKDLATFVPLFLDGPAYDVYSQISAEKKNTYSEIKTTLTLAFGVTEYEAYDLFRNRKLKEGETCDAYMADLRRLAAKIELSDATTLLRCAFIAGLPA